MCVRKCEDLINSVQQEGDSRLELATDSWVVTSQNEAHVWSMQEDEESGQLDHCRTKSTMWPSLVISDWNSQITLVVKRLTSAPCFAEEWLFIFHLIPYYKYPYTHKMYRGERASKENFKRETLEKNKIDSLTFLYTWFSKFFYSHLLHYNTHERIIKQILTSPYSE